MYIHNINNLGQGVYLPNAQRNYTVFDEIKTQEIVNKRENALPYISEHLNNAQTEEEVLACLHILDKMLDNGVKGIDRMYPVLSKYNNAISPNIQTMLAGIYRKTLIPDAFGPLNKMMIRQSIMPNSPYFDPTEEIGGAIFEYIKHAAATKTYGEINR